MRTTLASLLMAAALLLTGCGGDDDREDGDSGASTSDTAAAEPGADETADAAGSGGCPHLSAAEVSEVVGTELTELLGTAGLCSFAPPDGAGGGIAVNVAVAMAFEGVGDEASLRAQCAGEQVETDDSFACVQDDVAVAYGFPDEAFVGVTVDGAGDADTALGFAEQIVPLVDPSAALPD